MDDAKTNGLKQMLNKMQTNILTGVLLMLVLFSCNTTEKHSASKLNELPTNNLLSELSSQDLGSFKWMNEPGSFTLENGTLKLVAEKGTDFFNNPVDHSITLTAPLLFQEVKGDFVAKALVRPDFSSLWNAVALMVYIDEMNWIKFAFENSDATGQSIVSVVTRGVSDDANGVVLSSQDQVWLKLIRKGNIYSMLWSTDGKAFKMARLSAMPAVDVVKIGIEAQCPVGASASHQIDYFGLEKTTVEDLRKGL